MRKRENAVVIPISGSNLLMRVRLLRMREVTYLKKIRGRPRLLNRLNGSKPSKGRIMATRKARQTGAKAWRDL